MSVHELTIKALRTQPELFSSGKYEKKKKKVYAKVPSRTAFIRRRGGKMKKKYPGVSAEHIRCTPEDIVHLPDMNEDEIKQLLRQSVPALQ